MTGMQATETERFALRWSDIYPDLGTGPISTEPLLSEEYFQRERSEIFGKLWLEVGRVEEVARPGQYFVTRVPSNDVEVIVVRGRDDQIRAFRNVCSHRANAVTMKQRGQCRAFRCSFHAWNFGLDGTLRGVPDEASFDGLKKEEAGLVPVRVDVWEGFIFINLAENPAEELETYMGQFGRELAGYPFHEFTSCYQYLVTVRANWKVVLDAFQESYHAPFLHHASGDSLAGGDNPFLHALDISLFDRHRSMSVPRNPRHEPTELEAMSARFGAFMYSARSAGGPDTSRMPAGVNRTRSDRWLFDINVIFPTFFCDVANGNYFTYNFWPISRNETFWDVRMYYRPARSAREWISQEYSKVRLRDTLFEDLDTVEATQRGLESSGRDYIYIQDQEITIRHGHKVVEDHVRFYGDGK